MCYIIWPYIQLIGGHIFYYSFNHGLNEFVWLYFNDFSYLSGKVFSGSYDKNSLDINLPAS